MGVFAHIIIEAAPHRLISSFLKATTMFDIQILTAELLSVVAGRPISTYMQPADERTDGNTALWAWPSECENDDDRRAFAVGIIAADGFVRLVDVDETIIGDTRGCCGTAAAVGAHLKARSVKAPRKSRKAKVVAQVAVADVAPVVAAADIAPSAAALVHPAAHAFGPIAIVDAAAGRPVSTCMEARHDNADIIWYWPSGAAQAIQDGREVSDEDVDGVSDAVAALDAASTACVTTGDAGMADKCSFAAEHLQAHAQRPLWLWSMGQ
jgi:hypothetical protein